MDSTQEAGPALDAEIARVVFGIDTEGDQWHSDWETLAPTNVTGYTRRCRRCGTQQQTWPPDMLTGPCFIKIPPYSTNISAAWLVVERMLTWLPQEDFHLEHLAGGGWKVLTCFDGTGWENGVEADTAPLAICRAALSALEHATPSAERRG